jgi:outer membrane protein
MSMKLKTIAASMMLATTVSAFAGGNISSYDSVSADSAAATLKDKNSLGLGVAYSQQLYSGVDNITRVLPLFKIEYDRFFIKGFDVGVNAYENQQFSAAIILKPLFNQYEASDSSDLTGMEDRKISAYAGGQLSYKIKSLHLTAFAAQDVTDRTNGAIAGGKVSMGIPFSGGKIVVVPSVGATHWDADVVNYYFGVTESEATATRSEYSPDSTWVYNATLTGFYEITSSWRARLTYNYSRYGSEVEDSPITDRRGTSAILAGVSYVF